ncbi:uncharacterized protein TNCV_2568331 [Trichonephila clavipes]|uniref:Uncharacterized protein n=1 Tax=Trichonephila clavipes TaxID=2585209 RepID=A0A8X7BLX1_TRICX|nr:uncharacterized protein TNCV_2568331 [Trichonephila clavipes]
MNLFGIKTGNVCVFVPSFAKKGSNSSPRSETCGHLLKPAFFSKPAVGHDILRYVTLETQSVIHRLSCYGKEKSFCVSLSLSPNHTHFAMLFSATKGEESCETVEYVKNIRKGGSNEIILIIRKNFCVGFLKSSDTDF